MSFQELVLSSSSTLTSLHDLRTGSLLTSFKSASSHDAGAALASSSNSKGKGRAAATNGEDSRSSTSLFRQHTDSLLTVNGNGGIVVSIVSGGKAALNVWSYQKEAPLQRLLTPVKLACLALSKSGIYLAGGAHDGRILLWELASGVLVASFDAHYRGVTCLAWTDDDAALISGGDDAAAHVWSLPMMLASVENPLLPIAPYVTLSDHTLPVTSLHISFGSFPDIRLVTSSLDGTVKLWTLSLRGLNDSTSRNSTHSGSDGASDAATGHHPLLSSFQFPAPEQVVNVQLDALERSLFAATYHPGTSSSKIYKVNLYKRSRRGEEAQEDELAEGEDEEIESEQDASTGRGGRARWQALGGGGRGDVERVESGDYPGRTWTLPLPAPSAGNKDEERISALYLSTISSHLLVGTSVGQIYVLSLPSLQIIRTISPSQSTSTSSISSPITSLRSMTRPIDLISRTAAGASASGSSVKDDSIQPRPVANQLSRNLAVGKEADDRVITMKLGLQRDVTNEILPPLPAYQTQHFATGSVGPQSTSSGSVNLQEENARLRDQLTRAIAFNDSMWESLVDQTLAKGKDSAKQAVERERRPNGMALD